MIATKGPRTPAVAYYRMSTDRQETSIPDQRNAVEKYASEHGYKIIREFIDEGISGDATDKRIAFQEMVGSASLRTFKAILCWDIDRFGRFDSIEAGHWIFPLRNAGIHLGTVAQGMIDWSDFAGRIMYGIQQEAKNQYLTDLSRNVTRGMTRLAEQGLWAGGRPAFGYASKEKRLVLGPTSDVEIVRRLFLDYSGGKSLRGLADQLNTSGTPSPKGGKWTANGIAGMLRNRVYLGEFVWNRQCQSKYKRKGRATPNNSPDDWITIKDNHPAIVDVALFDHVQEQMSARKSQSTPHANGGGFVLSGMLVCGKCGHRMIGDLSNRIHHYTCYGYRQHGNGYCDRNSLRQGEILQGVLEALQVNFYNPATMARLADAMRRQLKQRDIRPDAPALRREIEGVETKLDKACRRLVEVDRDLVAIVQDHVRELRQQLAALKVRLSACEAPQDFEPSINKRISMAMDRFSNLQDAATKGDPVLLRQLIRESLDRVELFTERLPWTAKRFKYKLDHGTIWMKSGNLFSSAR